MENTLFLTGFIIIVFVIIATKELKFINRQMNLKIPLSCAVHDLALVNAMHSQVNFDFLLRDESKIEGFNAQIYYYQKHYNISGTFEEWTLFFNGSELLSNMVV